MQNKKVTIPLNVKQQQPLGITEIDKTNIATSTGNIDLEGLKASAKRISEAYNEFEVAIYIDEENLVFTPKGELLFEIINPRIFEYLEGIDKNKKNIQMEDWRSFPWSEHLNKAVNPGSINNRAVFMLWQYIYGV